MSDPSPARLPVRAALAVLGTALLAQAWTLGLSFQLDDYTLLGDPGALFERGAGSFMLRWPAWLLWTAQRALGPEVPSPLPHHAASLLLHGATAALLAGAVTRLAPGPRAVACGTLAGVLFAVAAGGIQAVSWTSAQPDLLVALFATAALLAFLRARDGRAIAWTAAAVAALLLALLSKTPALIVLPALLAVLLAARPAPRDRWRELAALALAAALTALARWLYTGALRPRYEDVETPGLAGLPGLALRAAQSLGQALVPWNRDPLFAGDGPLLGEHVGRPLELAGPSLALLAVALPAAAALARSPRWRRFVLAAAGLALLTALPSAVLYQGAPTNVLSRTVYLPLLAACAALAGAAAGLGSRSRVAGALLAGWLWLVLVDGLVHVARTERWADDERRAWTGLVEETWADHAEAPDAAPLSLLALVPDAGYGGIPGLGRLLAFAFRPPFAAPRRPGLDVRVFSDERALERGLSALDPASEAFTVLGPARESAADALDASATGAQRRAARLPRRWFPVRSPASGDPDPGWAREAGGVWRARLPVPRHRLAALRLELGPGPADEATLRVAEEDPVALGLPASDAPRVLVVAPRAGLATTFGPPVEEVRWSAGRDTSLLAAPPRVLGRLPELVPRTPRAGEVLVLDPASPPPAFRLDAPPEARAPWARLELVLFPESEALRLFSDLPARPAPDGSLELAPERLHGDPDRAPGVAQPEDAPWRSFLELWLVPGLDRHGLEEDDLAWRVTLHHEGGALAAASPYRTLRFRVP